MLGCCAIPRGTRGGSFFLPSSVVPPDSHLVVGTSNDTTLPVVDNCSNDHEAAEPLQSVVSEKIRDDFDREAYDHFNVDDMESLLLEAEEKLRAESVEAFSEKNRLDAISKRSYTDESENHDNNEENILEYYEKMANQLLTN